MLYLLTDSDCHFFWGMEVNMKEKIYSVDEVSKMLNMHTRTIRRYIKENKLIAQKVGKFWKIRHSNLKQMMGNNDFIQDSRDIWTQSLQAFVNEEKSLVLGKIQSCSIVDFYSDNLDKVETYAQSFIKKINRSDLKNFKFQYIYNQEKAKARFIFWGNPQDIASFLITFKGDENEDV